MCCQLHTPAAFTTYPFYRRQYGTQGRFGRVWKISPLLGLDPRTFQPVASCYDDYVIPGLIDFYNFLQFVNNPWGMSLTPRQIYQTHYFISLQIGYRYSHNVILDNSYCFVVAKRRNPRNYTRKEIAVVAPILCKVRTIPVHMKLAKFHVITLLMLGVSSYTIFLLMFLKV